MGLSLMVGALAGALDDEEGRAYFAEQLAAVSAHMVSVGLPPHVEPESCAVWDADMFGYSGLHYLRRVAAYLDRSGQLPPSGPGNENAFEDPVMEAYFRAFDRRPGLLGRLMGRKPRVLGFQHLMLHGDAEGYYLPARFEEVQFPKEELEVAGGMVGSAPVLLEECQRLAAALELPADLDPDSEALWEATQSQGEGQTTWERYGVESFTCARLMAGARASVESGAALVFN